MSHCVVVEWSSGAVSKLSITSSAVSDMYLISLNNERSLIYKARGTHPSEYLVNIGFKKCTCMFLFNNRIL